MNTNVTPMMAQYLDIKQNYQDALLFYRMGDFYELFFDDAVAAASALDIALTKRGKHLGEEIPMCGVPVHAAEGYLLTLIRKGFRVAVGEQLESPAEAKKRGSKSVVKRDVVRLVTPGTLTEESLLEPRRNNYLAAYSEIRGEGALAWADISTGEIGVGRCPRIKLGPELARLLPRELLVSEKLQEELDFVTEDGDTALTLQNPGSFDSSLAERRLLDLYQIGSLDAFGTFERAEVSALGALVEYLDVTQKGKLPLLRPPVLEAPGGVMQIDGATRRNLELVQTLGGSKKGSLLDTIDRTVSPGGGRLLTQWLASPSTDLVKLAERQNAVRYYVENEAKKSELRSQIKQVPDVERALGRLSLERGGPRDLTAIRDGLKKALNLANSLDQDAPQDISDRISELSGHNELHLKLEQALVAEPPLLARDGGFVADGFLAELDESRRLRDEGRQVVAELQASYGAVAGVPSLKIKHNNVLGYFIETTTTHAEKMLAPPLNETFIHRQTTANQIRFTTLELSELETKILNAGSRALEIEKQIFAELSDQVIAKSQNLFVLAKALSTLDVQSALADLAVSEGWARPDLDSSRNFEIMDGRHPVVEHALKRSGESFVANSCNLSADGDQANITLLTGPNMAGKSTFLRQNALISILAQIGSFVPASKASLGVVSQLFSRVGASDDLARGRSTFMVEMVETAAILNQADDRALVILDEIGRGTATYDGLSIAWATLEHLHASNRCRALFATHYHELTALAGKLPNVENATMTVKEWDGEIVFIHEVKKGAADRSYGVQVAKLAGLPASVIERARIVLDQLEQGDREGQSPATFVDDLPLFSAQPPVAPQTSVDPLKERVSLLNPDELSPRDALQLIYELKDLAGG